MKEPKLVIEKIENPHFLNEAGSYGSSFSRGTKVSVKNVIFYFMSGTASVNEQGLSVHQGDLSEQTERTAYNIEGLLRSVGATSKNLVKKTTYVVESDYDRAIKNALSHKITMDSAWFSADICRSDLLIELDGLAIKTRRPISSNPNLCAIINNYQNNLLSVMKGDPLKNPSTIVEMNGLNYLFLSDFVLSEEPNSQISSDVFEEKIEAFYKEITSSLEQYGASWRNVVNTRINLPVLLAIPPDSEKGKKYYDLFNPIRTAVFRDNNVDPYPSSTCVGTKEAPENMIMGMSVLAIYKAK